MKARLPSALNTACELRKPNGAPGRVMRPRTLTRREASHVFSSSEDTGAVGAGTSGAGAGDALLPTMVVKMVFTMTRSGAAAPGAAVWLIADRATVA
jgi:hypothetical protein